MSMCDEPDWDRFFSALADDRRRRVLVYLHHSGTASLQELCERLAEREGVDPHGEEFERIRVDLVHLHLPKLADNGLLSVDDRTNTVSREPLPAPVEQILNLAGDLDDAERSDDANE